MTPLEKLKAFTQTIITLNYKDNSHFETFLDEWEWTIDYHTCRVKELKLFNKEQDILITHIIEYTKQREYYDYFSKIKICN